MTDWQQKSGIRMGWLEIPAGLFLVWYSVLPFQNYEQLIHILLGCGFLWGIGVLFTRSRILFSSSIFFHFSLILAFYVRATMAQGWLYEWYLWIAILQWGFVLWLISRYPDNKSAPSVFLMIALLSPLVFPVMNPWAPTTPGIALWALLVLRLTFLELFTEKREIRIPWALLCFILLCFLSIFFSLYSWHNIQFLILNCLGILACFSSNYEKNRPAFRLGYLNLGLVVILFGLGRAMVAVAAVGPEVLKMRLSIVMFHNNLVPLFLILTTFLLYFEKDLKGHAARSIYSLCLVGVGILLLLTYSRNGLLAYLILLSILAWFRLRHQTDRKKILVACAALTVLFLSLLTFVTPVFRRMEERVKSVRGGSSYRLFQWKVGVLAIEKYPLFGAGWFNYYNHASLFQPEAPLDLANEIQLHLNFQNHSFFLDLAEAAGIPAALLFLWFLAGHFKKIQRARESSALQNDPGVLIAGLVAIFVNCVLADDFFIPPNYFHLWLFLGVLISKRTAGAIITKKSGSVALIALLLFACVSPLLQDRWLSLARFHHKVNEDAQALKELKWAQKIAPGDVVPLEERKEILLSKEDFDEARVTLHQLLEQRKDYPVYYAELGRIELHQKRFKQAEEYLLKARHLDPYSSISANTYLDLAKLYWQQKDRVRFEWNLCIALLLRMDDSQYEQARYLLEFVKEEELLLLLQRFVLQHTKNVDDWLAALDNFCLNAKELNRQELCEQTLHHILKRKNELVPLQVDQYYQHLSEMYFSEGKSAAIRGILPFVTQKGRPLLEARLNMLEKKFDDVVVNLNDAAVNSGFYEIHGDWKTYFQLTGQIWSLRKLYETLEILPSTDFNTGWRLKIASLYIPLGMTEKAAKEFHRLSMYQYTIPGPHWQEARLWWLAGDMKQAEQANRRCQTLIRSNWITQHLFQSEMRWHGGGIDLMAVPNRIGKSVWRTAVYANSPITVVLPKEKRFSRFAGDIAIHPRKNSFDPGSVFFEILDHRNQTLFRTELKPPQENNPGWNQFEWNSTKGPQSIQLMIWDNRQNPEDLALWSFSDMH